MKLVVYKIGGHSLGPNTNKASGCGRRWSDRLKANAEGCIRK